MPAAPRNAPDGERGGHRIGQLLALLGLTGFAISQPLLAVAGDDPTIFTFAGVRGAELVAFALLVAFVPPLVLWAVVVLLGRISRRAGDVAFLIFAGGLAGAAVSQWVWQLGLDSRPARLVVALLAAVGFAVLLVRVPVVAEWTRYTAVLPVLAVLMLLTASPASALLSSPRSGSSVDSRSDTPSIVFLMLDEFPLQAILDSDGAIDDQRFPNLASLAAESTWYSRFSVTANATTQSVPSILTGQLPNGRPPLASEHPDSLFTLLEPTHHFVVSETVTQLCDFATCTMPGADPTAGRGIPSLLSQMSDVWQARVALRPDTGVDFGQFAESAEAVEDDDAAEGNLFDPASVRARPERATQFLDSLAAAPTPTLGYLHLMLPHRPWQFAPDGTAYAGLNTLELALAGAEVDDWDAAQLQQSFLLQAQYTDRLVGEVIDSLRAADRFDDTLIVVTSDHGLTVRPDALPNVRHLGPDTLGEVAYTPLIIKSPGQQEGRTDQTDVTGIDLLPTIAAELGVEVTWAVDGFPAGSPEIAAREGHRTIYDYAETFGLESTPSQVIEFEVSEHRPSAAANSVAPLDVGDHLFAGLLRPLGADQWLGRAVADVDVRTDGTVTVPAIDELTGSSEREVPLSLFGGETTGVDPGDVLLVAIDGTIESGAPVREDGSFRVLLPPGVPRGSGTEVRLFTADGDDLVELQLNP